MVEAVPKTNQEKLDSLKQDVGKAFFDYGRIQYEIEVKQKELGNLSVNIHNLNKTALALQDAIEKAAKAEALGVKLAPPDAPKDWR